ncbi:YHYH protein [Granulosicoccus sp. 3-233]|uniref:YHYH protein n=1 Tax=Granulosicoccus sp. 3-233 TaxID=3417969 RepID=UPI003D34AB09
MSLPFKNTAACKSLLGATLTAVIVAVSGCSDSGTLNTDTSTDETDSEVTTGDTVTDVTVDETDTTTGGSDTEIIDIYNAVFSERSADCGDYVNTFDATVVDIQNSLSFNADVFITATNTECTITSNSVPNHDFNDDTAAFAGGADGATIAATDTVSTITRSPAIAAEPTALSQQVKNGVFLNGVRLDILSAGCYRPNSPDAGDDGNTGIGCSTDDPWLLDPLGTDAKFGADLHNAHTQPGGLYHYHGGPNAMFDDNPGSDGSPVIGFAADGFPIYGSYFHDENSGQVRKAISGYTLKPGSRGERSDTNPGGDHDGTYNDDWEFTNSGDLDECNGMSINGQYGYYVTDTYPWVIKCFTGTPHASFGGGDNEGVGPPPQDAPAQ